MLGAPWLPGCLGPVQDEPALATSPHLLLLPHPTQHATPPAPPLPRPGSLVQVSRRLQRRLYRELRGGGYGYVKVAVATYEYLLQHSRPEKSGLLGHELVVGTVVKRRRWADGSVGVWEVWWTVGAWQQDSRAGCWDYS